MHAVGSLRGMNHMTNSEYQFLSGLDKSIIMGGATLKGGGAMAPPNF